MKSEQEVRDEIEACKRTMENYRRAYKEKRIPRDVLKSELLQNDCMIQALRWVLGENDRFD